MKASEINSLGQNSTRIFDTTSFDVGNMKKAHELVAKAGIPEELIMNDPKKLKAYFSEKGKELDVLL